MELPTLNERAKLKTGKLMSWYLGGATRCPSVKNTGSNSLKVGDDERRDACPMAKNG